MAMVDRMKCKICRGTFLCDGSESDGERETFYGLCLSCGITEMSGKKTYIRPEREGKERFRKQDMVLVRNDHSMFLALQLHKIR